MTIGLCQDWMLALSGLLSADLMAVLIPQVEFTVLRCHRNG
jgi:hypothetical protein